MAISEVLQVTFTRQIQMPPDWQPSQPPSNVVAPPPVVTPPETPETPEEPVEEPPTEAPPAQPFTYVVTQVTLVPQQPPVREVVAVPLENVPANMNIHRIAAVNENGEMFGGFFDRASGIFTFETAVSGTFTIAYMPNLRRILVDMNSPVITCLAGNAPMQIMSVLPTTEAGRTLLPARYVAQALGGEANWNRPEITITIGGTSLTFREGDIVQGMDAPVRVIDGRTMVPARFIAEAFGAVVRWNSAAQTFEIVMA